MGVHQLHGEKLLPYFKQTGEQDAVRLLVGVPTYSLENIQKAQ